MRYSKRYSLLNCLATHHSQYTSGTIISGRFPALGTFTQVLAVAPFGLLFPRWFYNHVSNNFAFYNFVEQLMVPHKTEYMGDTESQQLITPSLDPGEQTAPDELCPAPTK